MLEFIIAVFILFWVVTRMFLFFYFMLPLLLIIVYYYKSTHDAEQKCIMKRLTEHDQRIRNLEFHRKI